jgi:hypothetical protein
MALLSRRHPGHARVGENYPIMEGWPGLKCPPILARFEVHLTGPVWVPPEAETKGQENNGISSSVKTKPESYTWYRVEINNRSITDESKREEIRKHLLWLWSKLELDELHPQLITIKYALMAGADKNLALDVEERSNAIQAKFSMDDEA